MLRRLARLGLAVLLAASLALSLWSAARIAADPMLAPLIERGQAEIAAAANRTLAREATAEVLAARLTALLAETPRNWIAIQAVEQIAADRRLTLPDALAETRAAAWDEDTGFLARAGDCAACIWDAGQCSLSNALICNAPVTISPLGDVLGLSRAGVAFARGEEIDQFDLGLSIVGLAATVTLLASAGSSASVKLGAGLMRLARRMDLLTPRLTAQIGGTLKGAVDWAGLAAVRSADDLAGVIRAERLAPLAALATDLGRLREATGVTETLHLLRHVDDAADARRLANLAEATGPRSLGLVEVLGKSRALRLTLRWSDEAVALVSGLVGMLAALASALAGLLQGVTLRLLRRLLRPA